MESDIYTQSALLDPALHWGAYYYHVEDIIHRKTNHVYRNNKIDITKPCFYQRALLAAVALGHGKACMTCYKTFSKMPETQEDRDLLSIAQQYGLKADDQKLKAHLVGMAALAGNSEASFKVATLMIDKESISEKRRKSLEEFYYACGVRGLTDEHPLIGSLLSHAAHSEEYRQLIDNKNAYQKRLLVIVGNDKMQEYHAQSIKMFQESYLCWVQGPEANLKHLLGVV